MKKCIVLLSGGLDSLLVTRLMALQNLQVIAMHSVNCFHGTQNLQTKLDRIRADALRLGASEVIFPDITDAVVELTKHPRFGRGRNMNPCIDCRLRTVREGFNLLEKMGADFIVTGEVAGQRPMSQRRDAMKLADKEVAGWGFPGLLLRPLSAKLLPPTVPEQQGWIDQSCLFDISGRSRDRQMELAEQLDLGVYPTPAGGCLLTDPGYSTRLAILMRFKPDWSADDAELLKIGRHFQITPHSRIVVSRNEEENYRLRDLTREDDFLYINNDRNGAIVMLRGVTTPEAERIAAGLAVFYSKLRDQGNANVMRWRIGREAVDQDIDQTIRPSQAVDPDTAREMEKSILAAAKN